MPVLLNPQAMSCEEVVEDQAGEAKKRRRHKKVRFLKYCNAFQNLIEAEAQVSMLEEAYVALTQAYKDLNKSHEDYTWIVE